MKKCVNISRWAIRLEEARTGLRLSRKALAARWQCHPNYIYLLEAGLNEFSPKLEPRVLDLEKELDKSSSGASLQGTSEVPPRLHRAMCETYFGKFLDQCGEDPAKIGWTLIELKERFPLNKWPKTEPTGSGVEHTGEAQDSEERKPGSTTRTESKEKVIAIANSLIEGDVAEIRSRHAPSGATASPAHHRSAPAPAAPERKGSPSPAPAPGPTEPEVKK